MNCRWRPIFNLSILPMIMLAISTLTVFSMEITFNIGNRFQVLFTIVLTFVANQIVIDGNLPKLPYTTWVDRFLFRLTLFIYFIIVETGAIIPMSAGLDHVTNTSSAQENADLFDLGGFYISVALIAGVIGHGWASAWWVIRKRDIWSRRVQEESRYSLIREELRLTELGFPTGSWAQQKSKRSLVADARGPTGSIIKVEED